MICDLFHTLKQESERDSIEGDSNYLDTYEYIIHD